MKYSNLLLIIIVSILLVIGIIAIPISFYNILYKQEIWIKICAGYYLFTAIIYIKNLWNALFYLAKRGIK